MKLCALNSNGFIMHYLISGPKVDTFIDHTPDDNQLRYEKYLRSIITQKQDHIPEHTVKLGEKSGLGLPWQYYYNYENWFVDLSTFYSELTKVALDSCTQLYAERDMEVKAIIWSYSSVDIWCNEEHVCSMAPPVYKPIRRQNMILKLKKGVNPLYIRLQTLGVRDTRTLFGIQITEGADEIHVCLPDSVHTDPVIECAEWLSAAYIKDEAVHFPSPAPVGTMLGYDSQTPDFSKAKTKVVRHGIRAVVKEKLEAGRPYIVVECNAQGQKLSRNMENISQILPNKSKCLSFEENKMEIFKRTAAVESLSRGGKFGFSISNILARQATGLTTPKDRELFLETLSQIEKRFDCSDFLVCGLIRYLNNYELDEKLKNKVKNVLLHYRFWMDQEGSDAMCFWSENHSLMFYVSAMNAGMLYPDEYFTRAHMTGNELYEAGKKRVEQWLEDVEEHGFEEFLSTVYMCVTFAGLLNAIDYTPKEISDRAVKVTDRLLGMLAMHTYKGSIIAPMGRVYRQVIYPFLQGAQALMNLVNPEVPYSYGEGWLAFYATSRYQIPDGLAEKMKESVSLEYETGNALIRLEKTAHHCMTSVQSPRQDKGFKRWTNLTLIEETNLIDKKTHEYTKSLNERFHGTTCFEPGVYGYQQHMWSAALDSETEVFTNHPGGTCDSSQMRPGYWFGNGVMPAIRQKSGILGVVYVIPEEHPIHFTHAFWPGVKFEKTISETHWLFGEKAGGYLALWCNKPMKVHQDQIFDCEYRSYGDEIAYCCIVSGGGNWETFIKRCKEISPVYDTEKKMLKAGDLEVIYEKHSDITQYI